MAAQVFGAAHGADTYPQDGWAVTERMLAAAAAFLIGWRVMVYSQVSVGYLVAFALTPLWLGLFRRTVVGRRLLVLSVAAMGSGVLLFAAHVTTHPVNNTLSAVLLIELAGVVAAGGALLWAMRVIGCAPVSLAFGLGYVASINPGSENFAANPWRFGFAIPVSIALLGALALLKRRWPEWVALVVLTAPAVASGARSSTAIQAVALIVWLVWYARGTRPSRSRTVLGAAIAVAALGLAAYTLGQALLLEGVLGDDALERTRAQLATSGVLLLGGRPEIAGTGALMAHHPMGYGPGVAPVWSDVQTARNAMGAIGYDTDNGYFERYMFGGVFRLHSVTGDLWATFGVVGAVLALTIFWLALTGISMGPMGRGDALLLVLALRAMWNTFFSPWYTSVPVVILLIAVVAHRRWLIDAGSGEAQQPPDGPAARAARV